MFEKALAVSSASSSCERGSGRQKQRTGQACYGDVARLQTHEHSLQLAERFLAAREGEVVCELVNLRWYAALVFRLLNT
jgi:hypothetical protein